MRTSRRGTPVRAILLLAVLVIPGAALATSDQQGECAYTGDWRAQAIPGNRGGPSSSAYAAIGGCALAEVVRTGNTWTWRLRADSIAVTAATMTITGGTQGDGLGSFTFDPIACAGGICALGPAEGAATSSFGRSLCAHVELRQDGVVWRAARACA